jgi:hypothetical protein
MATFFAFLSKCPQMLPSKQRTESLARIFVNLKALLRQLAKLLMEVEAWRGPHLKVVNKCWGEYGE